MPGMVIAFAGAIGTGRSEIARLVADRLHWPIVKFSDHIKDIARNNNDDPEDRAVLQRIGQELVLDDPDGFVRAVLGREEWRPGGNLIVDGLRHTEVRLALKQQVSDVAVLRMVYVALDEDSRQDQAQRNRQIAERMLSRYDRDLTEAQVLRILPSYADLRVNGALPYDVIARKIIDQFVPGFTMPPAAAPAGG
jgi:2-phosphoglycerate kinase